MDFISFGKDFLSQDVLLVHKKCQPLPVSLMDYLLYQSTIYLPFDHLPIVNPQVRTCFLTAKPAALFEAGTKA